MRTIGTAGHVDHGKSTLVHALTGMNPDRLQEELERQMTIDLGFAWMTLDNGEEVGIVDVPGHRDFIENMLAGVGSIDAVLFVIAADEGIMPQTCEHLAIIDLLQVPRGLIVLTKIDLVEEEWLELVTEEVRDLFSQTSLNGAPILSVSALQNRGLEDLRRELTILLEHAPARVDAGRPRLHIDRVFTLTGFGTVVTGTLIGGSFKEGQEVEIQPKGLKARIRSLQSHKNKRQQAQPGGRVALNLSGIDKFEVERGDTVVLPGQWKSTSIVDASFHMLGDLDTPLKHNQEVKIYHGASQRMARARLIGQPAIIPGEDGWIQLILSGAIVADRGDNFILRRPSPGATMGGGQIVDPQPSRRYRLKEVTPIERLEKLLAGDPHDVVTEIVRSKGPITTQDIISEVELEDVSRIIETLLEIGNLIALGKMEDKTKSFLMTDSAWEQAQAQSATILAEYHELYPLRSGMPIQEYRIRMQLDQKWATQFIESAVQHDWIRKGDNVVSSSLHEPTLTRDQESKVDSLLAQFQSKPYSTPSKREILTEIDEEILQYLLMSGQLVSLNSDVFLSKEAYSSAVEKIRDTFIKRETLTVAEVRDLFATSRKYALALMEHLDAIGLTTRDGDIRRLID